MEKKADLEKAGGILAFVAGLMSSFVGLGFAMAEGIMAKVNEIQGGISAIGGLFGMGGRSSGYSGGPSPFEFIWGLVFAYVTLIIGTLLISGVNGKIWGPALIVCAILAAFGGAGFSHLAILTFTGGVIAVIGGFRNGGTTSGSGVRGIMATAQRMAQAAKETDTSNAPEKKD